MNKEDQSTVKVTLNVYYYDNITILKDNLMPKILVVSILKLGLKQFIRVIHLTKWGVVHLRFVINL